MVKKIFLVGLLFTFLFSCSTTKTSLLYRDAYDHFQRNELEKAESVITQILYKDKRFIDAYVLRSIINQMNGKTELALFDLQMANSINPKNYLVHYNLGNIYFTNHDYNKAINEFSISLKLNKSFPNALLNRANTYLILSQYKQAIVDYKSYLLIGNSQKDNIETVVNILEKNE